MAIPVTILTGFLGSGKTTVLNHLLRQPELEGAVVIVNEFGEIGLDHLLIEASDEQFALLDNGCICCTVRGDLIETLKDIDRRGAAGELPKLTRILVETTGLADPAPILHTLMVEHELAVRYRIGGIVTTIDAVNGLSTLDRHPEAVKQVAVADRLLITKADLASIEGLAILQSRLADLSPMAEKLVVDNGAVPAADLLHEADFDDADTAGKLAAWFDKAAGTIDSAGHDHACGPACNHHRHLRHAHRHQGIQTYSFVISQPIEWAVFAQWLDYVTALKGEDLLRMKGLVHITDEPDRPLVLHGVQHVFHAPVRLDAWPSSDRRTRLVFIVRDIPRETIERTLTKFAAIDPGSMNSPPYVLAAA